MPLPHYWRCVRRAAESVARGTAARGGSADDFDVDSADATAGAPTLFVAADAPLAAQAEAALVGSRLRAVVQRSASRSKRSFLTESALSGLNDALVRRRQHVLRTGAPPTLHPARALGNGWAAPKGPSLPAPAAVP